MQDLNYQFNAKINNTFDIDAVERSIQECQMTSFKYLYDFQLNSTGYRRHNFKMKHMFKSNQINHLYSLMPRRWVLYVEDDFISETKRLAYKRSEFYEKEIDFETTLKNRNIFTDTFIVFIDGEAYVNGINIICKEDKTYAIFNLAEDPKSNNGIPQAKWEELVEKDADVTIFFIPNYGITTETTNAYTLKQFNASLDHTNTSEDNNTLSLVRRFNEVSSSVVNTTFVDGKRVIPSDIINDTIINNPKNTRMEINVLDFKNLLTTVMIYPGLDYNYFMLELQDYPIAIDNCMIFDTDGNFMHDITIDLYYPNIYKVNNSEDKELKIFVFYYENDHILQHTNELSVYHKYCNNILYLYQNDDILDIIKNYKPAEVTYSIKDYQGSHYYDDHFKYKVETMRTLCQSNPEFFRRYLINLGLKSKYMYIDCAKLTETETPRNGKNLFNNKFSYGYLNTNSGLEVTDNNSIRSDFIPVPKGTRLYISGLDSNYTSMIFMYDKDKNCLGRSTGASRSQVIINRIEVGINSGLFENVEYVRVLYYNNVDVGSLIGNTKIQIELDEFTDYESYYTNKLENKIRHDNSDSDPAEVIEFAEPHYMFVFRNDFKGLYDSLTIAIDGIRYLANTMYKGDKLDFLYIPCRMISNTSVLEFEKMKETIREYNFETPANVEYPMEIDEKALIGVPLLNDIFIVNRNTDKYVSETDYQIIATVNNEERDIVPFDSFIPCPKNIKIVITNEALNNVPLTLHIKKNYRYFEAFTQETSEQLNTIDFHLDGKNDKRHIRLYRNGRLVPRHIFDCRFPEKYMFSQTRLFPGMFREIGDVLSVESVPYKMKQVGYIEELPKNKIIDLMNMLDKPFDTRWHDVYLNGRKLNKNEIEILSATKIVIRETESLRWLEVVENGRDTTEYFGYMPLQDIVGNIIDSDNDFKDLIESTIEDMKDIEDPIVDEIVTVTDVILNDFFNKYIKTNFGMINPDLKQISAFAINEWSEILSTNKPFMMNGDNGRYKTTRYLEINSDKTK